MTDSQPTVTNFAVPVVAGMATVSVLNGLWSLPSLELYKILPHALGVYLPTALVALGLLWWVLRAGTLCRRDIGLDITGWTAPKRLLALSMILFMGYGGYANLPPPTSDTYESTANKEAEAGEEDVAGVESRAVQKPAWGDYCFWFVFLLSASLVELLVFICLGFCLTEKWLKTNCGLPAPAATALAALFAAFMFGIYHYTHEPRFHPYVFYPLMPVMLLNLACFVATRNFHLTLVLHNCFAAVGFTNEQYMELAKDNPSYEYDPAYFLEAGRLWPLIVSFVVPYLILNWLEFKGGKANR